MLELNAFIAATPPPKILPLFLKIAPYDLRQKQNQDKWRSRWQKFAEENPSRIDVSAWESALRKLSSYNGITLNQSEEESAYIERVFSGIYEIIPPSIRYDFSGIQGIHRLSEVVLAEFEALDTDQSRVCVLGMYGLPGSGKSTICRYLCEYLFYQFAGKVIYLELPTDAHDEELLIKSKELLKQLTNFNNKMDLSNVSNFREVYHMLRGTDFRYSRVLLVVDNISSQESGNLVKNLLRLGPAPGSKVLLVACSLSVLRPVLQEDGPHQNIHHVYGSISVPGLNKEEALRVLLQFGDGVGLADAYAPEAALTPKHRQIMEEVVSKSSFRGDQYLPLVLKIMGEQLRDHELDVEKWNTTMNSFWTEVGLFKKEALKKIVLKSFRKLPLRLQTLFLDVALFIFPLAYLDGESHELDKACLHLSLIHGCKSEEIEFEMRKLQKHGFLTIWKGGTTISVHDFYLEFAASIEETSKYYWSSGLRWSEIQGSQAIDVAGTTELGLRTVVLELDEGYEHFEVSSEFSSVKAMVLRNCKSLEELWGFANLKCLVSLEIHNCPSLKWVETPATGCKQPYLQKFSWVKQENNIGCNIVKMQQQQSSKKPLWKVFPENCPWIGVRRPCNMMAVDGLLFQMKGLQVLRLENTGIRQSMDMSGCLPQLRVMEVREQHMKHLRVCNLPNLERFLFFGDAKSSSLPDISSCVDIECIRTKELSASLVPSKGVMTGKEFLAGCPKLQEVYVQCVIFEDEVQGITLASSHLKKLRANRMWNVSRLPDPSASAKCLEELMLCDCRELRSLHFGCIYRNLQILNLEACPNVTEVSGLDGLPKLHTLRILWCTSLKIVSGLGDLVSLRKFSLLPDIKGLSENLQRCLLPDIESLSELREIAYGGPCFINGMVFDMRKLVNLESLTLECSSDKLIGFGDKVIGLKSLKMLTLTERCGTNDHGTLVDWATLMGTAPRFSLTSLFLDGLQNLRSLNGIQFLDSLEYLTLVCLPNLTCLQGIESLGNLDSLWLLGCVSVEEMPCLSALVKLQYLWCDDCIKLRSVVGCEGLEQLQSVWLRDCKSLARFPLDLKNWSRSLTGLEIAGSKFASGEALMAWAGDVGVPVLLCHASLKALRWELASTNRKAIIELLLDRVVQKALDIYLHADMQMEFLAKAYEERVCLIAKAFDDAADLTTIDEEVVFERARDSHEVLDNALYYFARLPKRRLIELCHLDSHFPSLLYFLFHHLCTSYWHQVI